MDIVQNAIHPKGRERRHGGTGTPGCAQRLMPHSRYGGVVHGCMMSCGVHAPGTHSVVAIRLKLASYISRSATSGPG